MASNHLILFGVGYALILIGLAWIAEQSGRWPRRMQTLLYGMSLGVYCSSWTFMGAVGNASATGWTFLPIYLGPILLFLFGWPFIQRLLEAGSRNRVTSIADFIGSRFGKDQKLAAAVAVVALIGTLPYIALQLRAIALAWSSATVEDWSLPFSLSPNASFFATLFLVWFAITFGTRVIDGTNRHRGLMAVVATESVVKLFAFLALGLFAAWLLMDQPQLTADLSSPFDGATFQTPGFYSQLLISAIAIICLPRQFHVLVVEYHDRKSASLARWMFPLYLAFFALAVLPLVHASRAVLGDMAIPGDSYVLALPSVSGQPWLTGLAFVGALSAATAMVLVATIALSLMISNELILPTYLRLRNRSNRPRADLGHVLRLTRRGAIVAILLLSWVLEQFARFGEGLAYMGLLAFSSAAQMMPGVVAGLYWQRAHRYGVLTGLLVGTAVWFYTLLLPVLIASDNSWITAGPWGIGWLAPDNLFGTGSLVDSLTHGLFWSLGANILCLILISNRSRLNSLDQRQAQAFMDLGPRDAFSKNDQAPSEINIHQLQSLLQPLLGEEEADRLWAELERDQEQRMLPHDRAPYYVVQAVESRLASIIGAASAHRAIRLLERQQPLQLEDIANLVGRTSEQLQFSRHLLQTTLENIPQGISVVDRNLNLVAWNSQYERLFEYPPRLLYIGCPIARIYEYNASRGLLSDVKGNEIHAAVERRLQMLQSGQPYRLERHLPNGTVIEIRGKPIPSGGYVTAYNDVTDYHRVMTELEEARDTLEERVEARTTELQQANASLQAENQLRARIEEELNEVHASKSRFLAGASHDLLQPINAARLLSSTLMRREGDQAPTELRHIDSALGSAETLISHLREISRLDSGRLEPSLHNVNLNELLEELASEFRLTAEKRGIELHYVPCRLWVKTDPHLMRRVIQNFMSNALNYTREGRVLLGCRRRGPAVMIQVWDTGAGIAEQDQQRIFEEFERLHNESVRDIHGLGLGLPIAIRIARLLEHPLECRSEPNQGSMFALTVPLGSPELPKAQQTMEQDPKLQQLDVLCIDNEPHLLAGLQALLTQFGCQVTTASSLGEAMKRRPDTAPELVIADYHLDHNETGISVAQALALRWNTTPPTLIISADDSDALRASVREAGFTFLPKPVNASSLRLTLRKLLRRRSV